MHSTSLVEQYQAAAWAPNTVRTYSGFWRHWSLHCERARLRPLPCDLEQVKHYIAHRAGQGDSVPTITARIAAIRHMHLCEGHEDPFTGRDWQEFVRGVRRTIGCAKEQVQGLTAQRLRKLRLGVDPKIAAVCAVMRDAMLRRSEAAALTWDDIRFEDDGSARLTVRRSKTDQEGLGAVQYLSSATVHDLLAHFKPKPGERVFGLTAGHIAQRIKDACKAAGLPGRYSGHSPRVGMAQDLAEGGATMPELMQAGRWRQASTPASYIRDQEAGRSAVAKFYAR